MAIPVPVCTVTPNSVTRTYASLNPQVMLADTNTPSPAASGREWQADTVAIKSTVGATGAGIQNNVPYNVNLAPGARNIRVRTTNADGTGTSSNVTLTVTDSVALTPAYTDPGLNVRTDPLLLSNEYKDPTLATPGVQTAVGVSNARSRGTIS